MNVLILLGLVGIALGQIEPYQEQPCSGNGGICVATSCCPYSNYISGQCPTQSGDIRCCYSTPTCPYNESPCQDNGGVCHYDYCCPYGNYISGQCPSQASNVRCCYSTPDCGGGGSCGSTAQNLACQILNHGSVYLLTTNPSGVNDGADSYNNIKDTCNGNQAKRSNYCCSSGCSPGGYTCLKTSVLQYILDVLNSNSATPSNKLQVNSIAGACHSSNSWHYQGTAVDFQVKSGSDYRTWMNMCSSSGARENLGPGDAGHSSHTHCAFSS
ncbi:uncharacterized protein [Ptychodera flava]|uniref:uncharacterized protein n=1 Tax=Ptychodera flava TaxID=63121 RepID=UPI003969F89D